MKIFSKPNISPIEADMDGKISTAYLFAIAAGGLRCSFKQFKKNLMNAKPNQPTQQTNSITNI
jgi:hypothetical protein